MSKLLSPSETFALLERLRQAVRELTGRAEQAERDFATRAHRLRAQHEQHRAETRARSEEALAATEAAWTARQEQLEAMLNARAQRIDRALANAIRRKLDEVEAAAGKRTFEIQRDLLEADRRRDTDTAANKARFEQFMTAWTQAQAAFQQTVARARAGFAGFAALRRRVTSPAAAAPGQSSGDAERLLEQVHERLARVEQELAQCHRLVLPTVFRFCPCWLCGLVVLGLGFGLEPALRRFELAAVAPSSWLALTAALGGLGALYLLGQWLARPRALAVAAALGEAGQLLEAAARRAEARFRQESEDIALRHASTTRMLDDLWKEVQAEADKLRRDWSFKLEEQARWIRGAHEERSQHRRAALAARRDAELSRLRQEAERRLAELDRSFETNLARLEAARTAARTSVASDWQNTVLPLYAALERERVAGEAAFPAWQPERWRQFSPPAEFAHAARLGELQVDLEAFCGVAPAQAGLQWPGPARLTVPLHLVVPREASVLFEARQSGQAQVIGALNNLILRLLTSAPPGRLTFTIFDPVGLGENFAGIMHLADFEERVINSRIWTQPAQLEQKLAELNEHIEKVTQMYLRNEYASLAEYNARAGRLAEKYHFLVIADFPTNFTEVAVKRLHSIAASGPRCGVHLLLHWDQRKPAPVEFVPEELRRQALGVVATGDGFAVAGTSWEGVTLTLDGPPEPALATALLHQIGRSSLDAFRVEMPFAEAVPQPDRLWSLDTTRELRVPIGRTGATKLQYLALGEGTRQHGLIAGKTGSGKSTLFHVIITNLALWCSPDAVEFYLVDFKKGVEFKCYATHRLPHARVVAIESDREFGLSVLQRVDEELKRRGDLFRRLGVQDLPGYKRAGGTEPMPRVLLLIDEFQEFFVEDDRIAQGAALLLDRIVRQGRAFGIHVLLGSQTLGGAYTLARATLGQMVVRIALQCNEADALLIMNEDNPAARLLSRPGEAIYNDEGGAIQGNSPFQVVWLPEAERDQWLRRVRARAEQPAGGDAGAPGRFADREPVVFEGNAPADVRQNPVLRRLLDAPGLQHTAAPRVFLGAPNSIKGPTEAVFRRQSGSHLLIVGQRDEAALALLTVALVSLAAQQARTAARFLVFDCSAPDSAEAQHLERVLRLLPHEARLVRPAEADEVLAALAAEQQRRADAPGEAGPETFLLVHRLHLNKRLRFDEEASFSLDAGAAENPGLQFNRLICEGAGLGFHVLATCDTYNNLLRQLSRKALSEFEMRVLFQMSANDSASLIDSGLANNLGLHRAILFNGHEGWLETFRPYALPDAAWLEEAGRRLARLHGTERSADS